MKNFTQPFHHLTVDPLNAATAEVLAAERGVWLEPAQPRDVLRLEKENALLIVDWDYLPKDDRDRVLASSALRVVAIHGFTLADSVVSFLRRRGVLCFKKLDPDMFRGLDGLMPAA